ncbi:30S ribosomal protein S19 [Candidatus Woesearchaeota archaeon]|nr:30S ribosomal protein S19 [Candidatus Woesearchaeota archaeon]
MAKHEGAFKGRTLEELQAMNMNQLAALLPSRQRRSFKHGFTPAQKKLLARLELARAGKLKKPVKTHCRDMIVLPSMINLLLQIYNGKEYTSIQITSEMVGHYLGEFALTRKKVAHSAPGIGATKSSSALSVK